MIKKAIFIFLFGTGLAQAQNVVLKEGDLLRGRFIQERHLTGFSKPVVSEGSFALLPGLGLIWQAEKPFAVITAVTAKGIVQSVNGTETARLNAARLPFLPRLYDMLSGALAGNLSSLESEFAVKQNKQGKFTRLILTPRQADGATALAIQSLHITIDKFVESVEVHKPGGDWDRLIFKAQNLQQGTVTAKERAILEGAH